MHPHDLQFFFEIRGCRLASRIFAPESIFSTRPKLHCFHIGQDSPKYRFWQLPDSGLGCCFFWISSFRSRYPVFHFYCPPPFFLLYRHYSLFLCSPCFFIVYFLSFLNEFLTSFLFVLRSFFAYLFIYFCFFDCFYIFTLLWTQLSANSTAFASRLPWASPS